MNPDVTKDELEMGEKLGRTREQIIAFKQKEEQEARDIARMQDILLHGGPFAEEAQLAKMFGCKSIPEYRAKYGEPVDESIFEDEKKFRAHLALMELKGAEERRLNEAEFRRRSREEFNAKHGMT